MEINWVKVRVIGYLNEREIYLALNTFPRDTTYQIVQRTDVSIHFLVLSVIIPEFMVTIFSNFYRIHLP